MRLIQSNQSFLLFILVVVFAASPFMLVSCEPDEKFIAQNNTVLRVVTRNAPTTYYYGHHGAEGFEFELVKAFADWSGRRLEVKTADSITELLAILNREHVDIAAAGLTVTSRRKQFYKFGPSYFDIEQVLVCPVSMKVESDLAALERLNLVVNKESSFEENLKLLQEHYPAIRWTATDNLDVEEILELVSSSDNLCTITDSNILDINRRYFPQIRAVLSVSAIQQLAWMVGKHRPYLLDELYIFFSQKSTQETIAQLRAKYYSRTNEFDYVDISVYNRRIQAILPEYIPELKAAADEFGLPWTLIAAQAYQESHWDPKARSPTGVRGFMMLTQTTAKSLGVTNRLDPVQNIQAGAKYLATLERRIPKDIEGPSRWYYALAAYNVGMGHLWDAIKLAKRMNVDYRKWENMEEILPLLAQKKYYAKLRYGYARGIEPVLYVKRIRNYHDILRQHQIFKEEDYYVER